MRNASTLRRSTALVGGCLALLAAGGIAPTTLGMAFIVAQALAVALFALLQFAGLRSSPPYDAAA